MDNIQKQPYILIEKRDYVEKVIETAKKNKGEPEKIKADKNYMNAVEALPMVTVITKMYIENGTVHYTRVTKDGRCNAAYGNRIHRLSHCKIFLGQAVKFLSRRRRCGEFDTKPNRSEQTLGYGSFAFKKAWLFRKYFSTRQSLTVGQTK